MTNLDALRGDDGKLISYAWPGGYPMFYLDRHNSMLCPECANRDIDDGEAVVCGDVYWEGPTMQCDDCGKDIESAYGDPNES